MSKGEWFIGSEKDVPAVLRDLRKRAGLTSRQAAAGAGVAQSSLAQWETGHHCPNVASLSKMLRFYRVAVPVGEERP